MAKGVKAKGQSQKFAPAISDDRFSRLQTDPRFLRPNREESKVVIDDRFKGLLSGDLSGNKKGKVDKYGRKIKQNGKDKDVLDDEMSRLYRLDNEKEGEASGSGTLSSSEGEEGQQEGEFIDYARGEGQLESSDEDSSSEEEESDSESESDSQGVTIGTAAARRKEKRRVRFTEEASDDDDGGEEKEGEGTDLAVAAKALQVNEGDLVELDARAERTVRREAAAAKNASRAIPKRKGDTTRLAAVNMDWDHIRSIDLYKVFSSLVSPTGRALPATPKSNSDGVIDNRRARGGGDLVPVKGRVVSVRIYPSNFGLERMAKENAEGPPRDIFKRNEDGSLKAKKKAKKSKRRQDDDDDESEDSEAELFEVDEGGEFDEEALRGYQLERLRYYYAIITFDTPEAARHIINEIDGTEMERTANVFDLSFVPEDMTFPDNQTSKEDLNDDGWRDEATEVTDGGLYKGVDFTTDALRHSKVTLTWDADDPQRSKITRQLAQEPLTVDALRDEDFKAYLASDSEPSDDEEGETNGGRNNMRSLLGLDGDENEDSTERRFGKSKSSAFEDGRKTRKAKEEGEDGGRDMQITFMPGLNEAAQRKKKGLPIEDKEETTLETYMRKQKEKKERKRSRGNNVGGEQEEESKETRNGKHDFDDPFFASDNEVDFEEALAAEQNGRGQKDKSKKSKQSTVVRDDFDPQDVVSREELQLMVDSDSDGDNAAGHFSMKDILKAEQEGKGKKSRWAKKKEKKKSKDDGRENEVQENFAIDVQDERFKGVFDDHRFALDPSHPSFIKTKNMGKLMEERRKRDKKRRKEPIKGESDATVKEAGSDLADLVQSVKKRSLGQDVDRTSKKKVRKL